MTEMPRLKTVARLNLFVVAFGLTYLAGDRLGSVSFLNSCIGILMVGLLASAALFRELRLVARSVRVSQHVYHELIENMIDPVLTVSSTGSVLFANRACRETLGYGLDEASSLSLLELVPPEDHQYCQAMLQKVIASESLQHVSFRLVTKAGKVIALEGNAMCRFHVGQPESIGFFLRDVTKEKSREAELRTYREHLEQANAALLALATQDELTGLKNRRAFQDRLNEEVRRAGRMCTPLSLLMIDVDHFKRYNDSLGHHAGDEILKNVARVVMEASRLSDVVARFGGDEFVLLLPDTDQQGALIVADRIRHGLGELTSGERSVTVSIGAATMASTAETGFSLLQGADNALYHSKQSGRNCATHIADLQQDPLDEENEADSQRFALA